MAVPIGTRRKESKAKQRQRQSQPMLRPGCRNEVGSGSLFIYESEEEGRCAGGGPVGPLALSPGTLLGEILVARGGGAENGNGNGNPGGGGVLSTNEKMGMWRMWTGNVCVHVCIYVCLSV